MNKCMYKRTYNQDGLKDIVTEVAAMPPNDRAKRVLLEYQIGLNFLTFLRLS